MPCDITGTQRLFLILLPYINDTRISAEEATEECVVCRLYCHLNPTPMSSSFPLIYYDTVIVFVHCLEGYLEKPLSCVNATLKKTPCCFLLILCSQKGLVGLRQEDGLSPSSLTLPLLLIHSCSQRANSSSWRNFKGL